MANVYNPDIEVSLTLPEALSEDGVTFYVVQVKVGSSMDAYKWTVKKRFKDFVELHDVLVAESGGLVSKESLPERKYFGNKDPGFILKRRSALEAYLISVYKFLSNTMPEKLADFLSLPEFDSNFVLRKLAAKFHAVSAVSSSDSPDGEEELVKETAEWTPLELHAISERLRSPLLPPSTETSSEIGEKYDFTNVADWACRMNSLQVTGQDEPLGTSNIIPNTLKYDFVAFRSLSNLILLNVNLNPEVIRSLGMLRNTLLHLQANRCSMTKISDLLLCDIGHKLDEVESLVEDSRELYAWPKLNQLDVRYNEIETLDQSLELAPNLKVLLMGSNKVSKIHCLNKFNPELTHLELADNELKELEDLHLDLGDKISKLDLGYNKLKTCSSISKLKSLKSLNLRNNRIKELENVTKYVSKLPMLEMLTLQGNKVTHTVDYRLKVFESFGKRCSEIVLDNEQPSQSEVDKVSVLMALRVAKEGLPPTSLFGNLPRRVLS